MLGSSSTAPGGPLPGVTVTAPTLPRNGKNKGKGRENGDDLLSSVLGVMNTGKQRDETSTRNSRPEIRERSHRHSVAFDTRPGQSHPWPAPPMPNKRHSYIQPNHALGNRHSPTSYEKHLSSGPPNHSRTASKRQSLIALHTIPTTKPDTHSRTRHQPTATSLTKGEESDDDDVPLALLQLRYDRNKRSSFMAVPQPLPSPPVDQSQNPAHPAFGSGSAHAAVRSLATPPNSIGSTNSSARTRLSSQHLRPTPACPPSPVSDEHVRSRALQYRHSMADMGSHGPNPSSFGGYPNGYPNPCVRGEVGMSPLLQFSVEDYVASKTLRDLAVGKKSRRPHHIMAVHHPPPPSSSTAKQARRISRASFGGLDHAMAGMDGRGYGQPNANSNSKRMSLSIGMENLTLGSRT
ncbi:hypothetical protein BC832DRAFT_414264 [Gaertneriomyces semiglobifer]|nr:hypothetical protein BC832DRAFT_414264 [Gaertneriomyces semiglobifer]